jgi:hypothetical protein
MSTEFMKNILQYKYILFSFTIIWLLAIIIVNPIGNFPLNDDWVYARASKAIAETGKFSLEGGNTSANIIVQSLYGSIFLLPFGFSFTALRISTLLAGLIGVYGTFLFYKTCKINNFHSTLGSLLIMFNPLFFGLSFTYMTDVHFYALYIFSIYFLLSYINNQKNKSFLVLGIVSTLASILVRQIGILTIFAFGLLLIYRNKFKLNAIIVALISLLLGIITQLSYEQYLHLVGQSSVNFGLQMYSAKALLLNNNLIQIAAKIIISTFKMIELISIFYFPLIFLVYYKLLYNAKRKMKIALATFGIAILYILVIKLFKINVSHLLGNILNYYGIDPITLHDTFIMKINMPHVYFQLIPVFYLAALFIIFGCIMFTYIMSFKIYVSFKERNYNNLFNILLFLIITISLSTFATIFDRYILALLPLVYPILMSKESNITHHLSKRESKYTKVMLSIMVFTMSIISILITHDYLSWNRVRWEALNGLVIEKGISPKNIDGGYEFNGWFLYDKNDKYANSFKPKPYSNKSWWYVHDDKYILSIGHIQGYKIYKEYSVPVMLPISINKMYLLERK